MRLSRIELILEKKCFFNFLGADFLAPKSGHRREKQQPVLGTVFGSVMKIFWL